MRVLLFKLLSRLYRALASSMQAYRHILSCGVRGDGSVWGISQRLMRRGEDVIGPVARLKDLILDEM